MFEIVSPIIGIHLNPLVMLVIGVIGGLISGFLSTGCGLIITPLLIDLGLPPCVAIPTQLCHAVGTNFTNFLVYKRKSDVDFILVMYILLGGCIGTFCEWLFLKNATNPQTILNKFLYIYVAILGIFGLITLYQSFYTLNRSKNTIKKYSIMMRKWMTYLPYHKVFGRSRTEMSVLVPIGLGIITGMLVASLGGGSNLFMAPILTYLIERISPVVYGTVSMASFVITVLITFVYASQNYCCDIIIVMILFAGASFGSWCGVKLSYKVPRYRISIISGVVMLCMAGKQVYKIFNCQQGSSSLKVLMPDIIVSNPNKYTLFCVSLIIIVAYFYEKILENFSKTRWFRKQ